MAQRYDERERRPWRDVDEQSDPYYRSGRTRDFRRMRNESAGTGYQGRPERRPYRREPDVDGGQRPRGRPDYGPTDEYGRSDFARSDRPQRYGRSDYGREPYGPIDERGDFARSDRPQRYGRRASGRAPLQRGDYAPGDYRQGEMRGGMDHRRRRRPREPYTEESAPGSGRPTTWSYTEHWMIPGPYTGTGPSGYQRSDERILEDVCERMTRHGYLDAGTIEVEADDGIVTLRGTVDGRRTKRMAEDTAESVGGVWDIDNRLTVRRGEERETPETPQP